MAHSIGIVKSIEGIAIDTNAKGKDKVLKVGDVINVEDTIDTIGAGSSVVLALTDGQELSIGGNDGVYLDKSVYGTDSFGNDAVASSEMMKNIPPGTSVADIQDALLKGEDINNLAPTAAGNTSFAQLGTAGGAQYLHGGHESNVNSSLLDFGVSRGAQTLFTGPNTPDVNDAPVITSENATGSVTEDAANPTLSDSGVITFSDADFLDTHTARVSSTSDGALGHLELATPSENPNSANGSVAWTYVVPNSATQYLAVNETKTETFAVTIDDGNGGTVTQDITVTITGTNDAPVITTLGNTNMTFLSETAGYNNVLGVYTFDADGNPANPQIIITGTNDPSNLGVSHALGLPMGSFGLFLISNGETTYPDIATSHVSFDLNGANPVLLVNGVASTKPIYFDNNQWNSDGHDHFDTTTNSDGSLTIAMEDLNMGDNDRMDLVVNLKADGASVGGTVVEIADGASGENVDNISTSGTLNFNDVDLSDTHTVSFTPSSSNYIGTFVPSISTQATGGATGEITWSFSVNDSLVDHLGANESIVQTYTVEVSDGHGGTTTQDIAITIQGTNDKPIAVADSGATTENAPLAIDVLANDTDADTNDTISINTFDHTTSGGGVVSLVDGKLVFDPGHDFDHLRVGEIQTVTFNYTAKDNSLYMTPGSVTAQHGISDQATVTLTVTGTNDAPISQDFTLETNSDSTNINFDPYVSDIEDDVSNTDAKITMVEITALPSNGSLTHNGAAVDTGDQYNLQYLKYTPNSPSSILLGAKETDTSLGSWGSLSNDGKSARQQFGDITAITTSNSGVLKVYNHKAGHIGYGIADNDHQGINAGETITVHFTGGAATSAEVGFDGLGSYFNPDSTQQAKATWTALLNGHTVGAGEVTNLGDGTIFHAETIKVSGGFDTLVFGNTELNNSGSNYEVRYVDANFAHNDSFTYKPIDSDGLSGNESTVSLNHDSMLSHGTTTDGFLIGGENNDTISFDSHYQIDGGAGTDTLLFQNDTTVDLSGVSNIKNIEVLDLTHANVSISNLNANDVLDMTDSNNIIKINGDSGDIVHTASVWSSTTGADAGYTRYESTATDNNGNHHQVSVDLQDNIVHTDF